MKAAVIGDVQYNSIVVNHLGLVFVVKSDALRISKQNRLEPSWLVTLCEALRAKRERLYCPVSEDYNRLYLIVCLRLWLELYARRESHTTCAAHEIM